MAHYYDENEIFLEAMNDVGKRRREKKKTVCFCKEEMVYVLLRRFRKDAICPLCKTAIPLIMEMDEFEIDIMKKACPGALFVEA